ncbi:MAG: GNAT family N-acetyltransferase [Caldilineaceae bacterium]|nr:GNAT family N-acetyltransferase [Caldilineaceae bacterium]
MTPNDFRVVDAAAAGIEALCDGFNSGFRDYKYASYFDPPGMTRFLERSAMRLEDCAVMLAQEDGAWKGVGAALLAVEDGEAWCGGLAVDAAQRRQGGAKALMQALHSRACSRGAATMWLEVLVHNAPARSLYRGLGYQKRRDLFLWERPASPGNLPSATVDLQPADALDLIENCYDWHNTALSWQRRRAALMRAYSLMDALVLEDVAGQAVGYILYHHNRGVGRSGSGRNGEESVHIFDMAVAPGARSEEHADLLATGIVVQFPDAKIALINEPKGSILNPLLANIGFQVADRQFELSLDLSG